MQVPLHIVLGVVNDKDLSHILPYLPQKARYYFCKADIPRGKDAKELQAEAARYQLHGKHYVSVTLNDSRIGLKKKNRFFRKIMPHFTNVRAIIHAYAYNFHVPNY